MVAPQLIDLTALTQEQLATWIEEAKALFAQRECVHMIYKNGWAAGPWLCRLMRLHKLTIRDLARRLDVPLKTVRRRRATGIGINEPHVLRDWLQAITGIDPGPLG
jgi:hypothetical protein